MRVRVTLGHRKKLTTGWCVECKLGSSASRSLKDITEMVDLAPLCDPPLVRLVLWMSHYYQTPAGQVFDALVPSSVRSGAGTRDRVYYTPDSKNIDDQVIKGLPTKQQTVIRFLIAAGRPMTSADLMVQASCTSGPIKTLEKKGLIRPETRREMSTAAPMRWSLGDGEEEKSYPLTGDQRNALERVVSAVDSEVGKTLLLHGVTGSGKTEVYIRAIEHLVKFGRSAIVLVPEISLTPQTRGRFERRFNSVAVLHSQMTPAERHFQWQRIRSGDVQVVVGPRSAVFAPLPRLGLIILDEEHDGSFKQDSVPRYHARKVAHAPRHVAQDPVSSRHRDALDGIVACLHDGSRRVGFDAITGRESADARRSIGGLASAGRSHFGRHQPSASPGRRRNIEGERASDSVAQSTRIRHHDSMSFVRSRGRVSGL